jgi:CheY-like chemotaxis protein
MNKPVLLVAEDNELDAMLLERVLQRCGAGFHLVRVEHGEAAIQYLQGAAPYADRARYPLPDLLLLDLKMPRKDGFAVLKVRQETPALHRVPAIVFSSSNLAPDIARAYALGASSYVVKPTNAERLERFARALLEWWGEFNLTRSPS